MLQTVPEQHRRGPRRRPHDGGAFDFIQLRVVTLPVAAARHSGREPPAGDATENRLLPWWKVTPHGN